MNSIYNKIRLLVGSGFFKVSEESGLSNRPNKSSSSGKRETPVESVLPVVGRSFRMIYQDIPSLAQNLAEF